MRYSHRRSNESVFGVTNIDTERSRIVDIQYRTCSCKEWQQYGIPCRHAAHCLLHMRKDIRRYVDEEYRVTSYVSTYSGDILPIPPKEDWPPPIGPTILPPIKGRKAGRPSIERKKRGSGGRSLRCKRCGQIGHNLRTCQEPILPEETTIHPEEHADFNEAEAYDFGDVHFSGDLPPTPQLMGPFSAVHFGNI